MFGLIIHTSFVVTYVLYMQASVYLLAYPRMHVRRKQYWNLIWAATKWPSLVLMYVSVLLPPVNWTSYLLLAIWTFLWWMMRKVGDDDHFKRLLRKARGKVVRSFNRLVVAPVTSN